MFIIFNEIGFRREDLTGAEGFALFLQLALGGPACGLVNALILEGWLDRFVHDWFQACLTVILVICMYNRPAFPRAYQCTDDTVLFVSNA